MKSPVVTTSPIGITTTTVYDAHGNSKSTLTDPTGKILSTTTMILDSNGGSKSTTADANGKTLKTVTKTPNKNGGYTSVIRDKFGRVSNRIDYDSTGKIVSQGKKITTTGTNETYRTGKDDQKVFLGQGSQKQKIKNMNELLHQDKTKEKEWATTSGSSSKNVPNKVNVESPSPGQTPAPYHGGGHGKRR